MIKQYFSRGDYVPGIWVDGMDILAVRECFKYAVNYAASGKGPLVIEAATYRLKIIEAYFDKKNVWRINKKTKHYNVL